VPNEGVPYTATTYRGASVYFGEKWLPQLISTQYTRSPLLTYLTSKNGDEGGLRPNASVFMGGARSSTYAMRSQIAQAQQVNVTVQSRSGGAGKNMAARDTLPTLPNTVTDTNADRVRTAFWKPVRTVEPCFVWNSLIRGNNSAEGRRGVVQDAIKMHMQEHFDRILRDIYIGNPTAQDAEIYWDAPLGIDQICSTTNVYAGINRTTDSFWRSNRITANTSATLALIDDANYTQGIADTTEGVDLCLLSKAAYLAVKAEALTKGGTPSIGLPMDMAKTGLNFEAIKYGKVMITYDPWLKDYSGVGGTNLSSAGLLMNTDHFVFATTRAAFKIGEMMDVSKYTLGAYDASKCEITTEYYLICDKPKTMALYTALV
jgi:hypothetical protein